MSADVLTGAFYSPGEAADELGISRRQLKHWLDLFPTIQPARGSEGQRLYSERDLAFFEGVRALIFGRRLLMQTVRRLVEEKGVEHLCAIGRASRKALEMPDDQAPRTA